MVAAELLQSLLKLLFCKFVQQVAQTCKKQFTGRNLHFHTFKPASTNWITFQNSVYRYKLKSTSLLDDKYTLYLLSCSWALQWGGFLLRSECRVLQPKCKFWSLWLLWSRGTSGNSKWVYTLLHCIQKTSRSSRRAYTWIYFILMTCNLSRTVAPANFSCLPWF